MHTGGRSVLSLSCPACIVSILRMVFLGVHCMFIARMMPSISLPPTDTCRGRWQATPVQHPQQPATKPGYFHAGAAARPEGAGVFFH